MILIESLILLTIDSYYYKTNGFKGSAKAAKIIGVSFICVFTVLYIANKLFFS